MDSITQAVLGAAVGEAVLGKKVGNHALLWGAIAGTIPDLDVFLSPFLNEVERLVVHRGFSHSIIFAIGISLLLGYLVQKIPKYRAQTAKDWCLLFFWCIFTHPLLDAFTNYGTQLFWPFSDYRVAFNTIFVIDPLYTLPLAISLIWLMFYRRDSKLRKQVSWGGIAVSSLYLTLTVFNKFYVENQIKNALQNQQISYSSIMTVPAPLNNIL